MSLRWQILLWIGFLAFVPLLIMASQGYHCARQAIFEAKQSHLQSVLRSRRTRYENRLATIDDTLAYLAVSDSIQTALSRGGSNESGPYPAAESALEKQRTVAPLYECLYLLDGQGQVVLEVPDKAQSDGAWMARFQPELIASNGLSLVSDAFENGNGMEAFVVARPVHDRDGNRAGYLAAKIDFVRLLEPLLRDREGLGEKGEVYVWDSSGKLLYGPWERRDAPSMRDVLPQSLIDADAQRALPYRNDRGNRVLGASISLPTTDWILIAEIDWEEAFEWLGRLRMRALATGTVTLFLVLGVALHGARLLSRPLRRLATVARRIAAGHTEERLGDLRGAEAEEVARAFNAMLDQLAASQRRLMQMASLAAVGEISSSTVHEMRNPLSSVKINLQALKKKVEGDPTYSELAAIALDQVERVERMLTDLLQYGKPLELKPRPVRFSDLAGDILPLVQEDAQAKNVSIRVEDRLGDRKLNVDPEQIRRALTNLVVNAVQAVNSDGTVWIEARLNAEPPERVVISVVDDGPGVADDNLEKIFRPFFTTRTSGTGLGLANVRKIVEYHGGTVLAGNHPERGAVFTLHLPMGGPPG